MLIKRIKSVFRIASPMVFLLLMLIMHSFSCAQTVFVNKGVEINNLSEKILISGDLVVDSGGYFNNSASIILYGNLLNYSDSCLFNPHYGELLLRNNNMIIGGTHSSAFHKLIIEKCDSMQLLQDISVNDSLKMIEGNIDLNGFSINLDTTGLLSGEIDTARIYGDSGKITATRFIDSFSINENIAGLGIYIQSTDDSVCLRIERKHNSENAADSAIFRNYTLFSDILFVTDSIQIKYFEFEKVKPQNETSYKIFSRNLIQNTGWRNNDGNVTLASYQKNVGTNFPIEIDSVKITIASDKCQISPPIIIGTDTLLPGIDSIPVATITCYEDTVTVLAESDYPNPFVSWRKDSIPDVLSNPLVTSEAGMYKVSLEHGVTGCRSQSIVFIDADHDPVFYNLNMDSAVITCSNPSVQLRDTNYHPDYIVSWILPDGSSSADPCTASNSGYYYPVLTDISSGCFGIDSVFVERKNIFDLHTTNDTIVCKNSIVVLEASEINNYQGVDYVWSNGTQDSVAVVFPEQTQTYYVSATSAECSGIDSVTVRVSPEITDSIVPYVDCSNADFGTISVYASGGTLPLHYSIDDGVIFSDSCVFQNLPFGFYNTLIEDSVGCLKSGSVYLDSLSNLPEPLFIASSLNENGDTIVLVDISHPTHPDSVRWVFNPSSVEIIGGDMFNPVIIFPDTGVFSVTMIAYWGDCIIDTTKPVIFNPCAPETRSQEMLGIKSVVIGPNPNDGNFFTEIHLYQPQDVCIQVWNLKAQLFFSQCFNETDQIVTIVAPDQNLGAGEYVFRVISKHGSYSLPFIVGKSE